MKNLNLTDSHNYELEVLDDEIEDAGVIEDKKNEILDGEIDEDITYQLGEHLPIERECLQVYPAIVSMHSQLD